MSEVQKNEASDELDAPPRLEPEKQDVDVPAADAKADAAAPDVNTQALPHASQINPDIQLELDRFGRHVDVLTEAVLESADLANRSAMSATTVSESLRRTLTDWNEVNGKNIFYLKVLVAVGGVVMFLSTVLFTVAAMRVGARTAELDAMLLAVGKRVVELNAATQSVEALNQNVQAFNAKQEALSIAQLKFETTIRDALKEAQAAMGNVPVEAAKQVGATNGPMLKEIGALKSTVEAQRSAVKNLDTRLSSLSGKITDVEKLSKEVNAMVILQRERYLEALQKTTADQAKPPPKPLAYPRVQAESKKP